MGRSFAVLVPALAAPGVFLFGCGGAGGDPDVNQKSSSTTEATTEESTEPTTEMSTESTTARATTTTSVKQRQCPSSAFTLTTSLVDDGQCQDSVYTQNFRPNAEYCDSSAKSIEDCCGACQQEEKCDAWVFNNVLSLCSLVLNDALWAGVLDADGWTMGAKMKGQCNGCDECGHNPDFTSDKNATCGDCNGDNWFQYPCFLDKACMCGGGPGPSDGPSAGPSSGAGDNMFEDGAFDFVALV